MTNQGNPSIAAKKRLDGNLDASTPDEETDGSFEQSPGTLLANLKAQWRARSAGVPELFGSPETWYDVIMELLTQVQVGGVSDLATTPHLPNHDTERTWSDYWAKLRPTQLLKKNDSGSLDLSDIGVQFMTNPSKPALALLLHDRVRAFGELLALFKDHPRSVADANKAIQIMYPSLKWESLASARRRIDWFRALDLVAESGRDTDDAGKGTPSIIFEIQSEGSDSLSMMTLVPPNALTTETGELPELPPTPASIIQLEKGFDLQRRIHREPKFSTLPSPRGISTRKIDTIREISIALRDGLSKDQMDEYLVAQYNNRSGQSIRTGFRAARIIEETKGRVFRALQGDVWEKLE